MSGFGSMGYGLWVMSYRLWVISYELKIKLRYPPYKFPVFSFSRAIIRGGNVIKASISGK